MTPVGIPGKRDQGMSKRRNHDADLLAHAASETAKGERTVLELATKHGVHPSMIHAWKKVILDHTPCLGTDWSIERSDGRLRTTRILPAQDSGPPGPGRSRTSSRAPW